MRDQLTSFNVNGGLTRLSDLILMEILSNLVYLDDFTAFLRISSVVSVLGFSEHFLFVPISKSHRRIKDAVIRKE